MLYATLEGQSKRGREKSEREEERMEGIKKERGREGAGRKCIQKCESECSALKGSQFTIVFVEENFNY